MSTTATADPAAVPSRLRGFHPGWYGAVMGTAIVGIVSYQNPGAQPGLQDPAQAFGVLMVGLSALLAVVLGIPYVARWFVHGDAARADLANPAMGALYGTFAGGILVLAVGISTVGPSVMSHDAVATLLAVLSAIGITLAFVMAVVFAAQLFLVPRVEPQVVNGAWFIPPVVPIIAPMVLAPLAPSIAPGDLPLLVFAGYALWGMGFFLFVLVASLLFDRLVFHPLPAVPMAPSLWIGLGPLGVAGLALLQQARVGSPLWGDAAPIVVTLSTIAAIVLWGFALWWLAAAAVLLVVFLRRGPLPYGIGWWAFTFPMGAFAASTLALGRVWRSGWIEGLAVVMFVALVATWAVVSIATLRAVRSGAAFRR